MNQADNSKFAPALPDDNENVPTVPDSNDSTVNIYEGVAECTMNDSDNLKNVKLRAKDLAQENVQKKIAEYIYLFLKDRCLLLPEDETLSVANEISNITEVKYNALDSDDEILIRATVTAQINDNDIMNYIIKCFKEGAELKSQNEVLRKENDNLKYKIAELTTQIISKDKIALANQKNNEADKLRNKSDYESAIKLYSEAIELNPNAYYLYENRGECYQAIGEYEKAIQDYSEAIKLHPNISRLYKMRGECYQAIGNEEKANEDFKQAEELGW